jgi:glucokinase
LTATDRVLLADVGGTNARFAVMDRGVIGTVGWIRVTDSAGISDAVGNFLGRYRDAPRIGAAMLGVAGTVENNRCLIVNSQWEIDGSTLRADFGFERVELLNDFEALAWSLPLLAGHDLYPLGSGKALPGAPMLVLGPGTGFGAACLAGRDRSPFVLATEAGHGTLPAVDAREDAVIERLRRRFEHVSVERALSGQGLENLYTALGELDNGAGAAQDAIVITREALAGSNSLSDAALATFCALLGTVAGNLALTFRARGGVFLGGGIAPRIAAFLAQSEFRRRFDAKGRYHTYLEAVPVNIIMRPDATFLGLKAFIEAHGLASGR